MSLLYMTQNDRLCKITASLQQLQAKGRVSPEPDHLQLIPTIASFRVDDQVFITNHLGIGYQRFGIGVGDILGAFMQAKIDKEVHVQFTGLVVDLLLELDPDKYGPYVVLEKGK